MRIRRPFLEQRRDEINDALAFLNPAIAQFDDFILNSVAPMIDARNDLDDGLLSEDHPFHFVYGWQDPLKPDGSRGLWHIVKVEARIPQRCGTGSCAGDPDPFQGADPDWPRVHTYNKGGFIHDLFS